MKRPTIEQIQAEAEKLRQMKPTVIAFSAFGDSHHAAIEAQVKVLEEGIEPLLLDDVADTEEWPDNVRRAAMHASEWADGEENDTPSERWQSLVKK